MTLEEGWPSLLPFDDAVAEAMRNVGLVDDELRVPGHARASLDYRDGHVVVVNRLGQLAHDECPPMEAE